ncbi:hypothetical protein [Halococcus sp. IIIV-5B]|uniref:hypothetical protein n=1 Tax=Halococcus sp. IIIV-5B TaxID=2321230 RepID=UPI001F3F778E|nr:hypothetical protein [Halococcus sp. IIIV-5B]
MAVTIHLTAVQWAALVALLVVTMFPFVVAPLSGSLDGFLLGLPVWFWVCFAVALVMYALVVVFITAPGSAAGRTTRTSRVK